MTIQTNGFSARFQEQLKDAQAKASSRAKEIEAEARKAFASLSEKVPAELKLLLDQAEATSIKSLHALGAELVNMGKRLQDLGKVEVKAEEKPAEEKVEQPKAQA